LKSEAEQTTAGAGELGVFLYCAEAQLTASTPKPKKKSPANVCRGKPSGGRVDMCLIL